MLRKRYRLNWMFECPDAVLTCSILKCPDKNYILFGGHDKTIYLMDEEINIIDDRVFDGWCRCSYTIDLDGDGYKDTLADDRLDLLSFMYVDEMSDSLSKKMERLANLTPIRRLKLSQTDLFVTKLSKKYSSSSFILLNIIDITLSSSVAFEPM